MIGWRTAGLPEMIKLVREYNVVLLNLLQIDDHRPAGSCHSLHHLTAFSLLTCRSLLIARKNQLIIGKILDIVKDLLKFPP